MNDLARTVLAACLVALVAMSVLLTPANATVMIACDAPDASHQVSPEAHAHGASHDDAAHTDAADSSGSTHTHPEGHCASHSCVVGVSVTQHGATASLTLQSAEQDVPAGSLVDQSAPEGLRRPPRA